jgi:hypothetical protein
MMHLMRPADALGIPIIGISENLEPLVYKNVVYKKVGDAISQDSKT